MGLHLIEAFCEPGGAHNEDAWGRADGCVWVLDGATGIGGHPHISEPSDAAWFSQAVNSLLAQHMAQGVAASTALEGVARDAARAAGTITDIGVFDHYELPCASLTLARDVAPGRVEFANLGDCRLYWRAPGGMARSFGTSGVAALDARMEQMIAEQLARGVPVETVRAASKALARDHRKLMNRPGGYWILDLSGEGAPHVQSLELHLPPGAEIMLMSDGFSRLVDLYRAYDLDGLMDAARARGLAPLYEQLRNIEAEDPECRTFARNKVRDDATAVLLTVS